MANREGLDRPAPDGAAVLSTTRDNGAYRVTPCLAPDQSPLSGPADVLVHGGPEVLGFGGPGSALAFDGCEPSPRYAAVCSRRGHYVRVRATGLLRSRDSQRSHAQIARMML